MPCGYSDKILNNKKLILESIKNMSIDDIVNLYRQGYRFDEVQEIETSQIGLGGSTYLDSNKSLTLAKEIYSLTLANPEIMDATGSAVSLGSAQRRAYILYKNSLSYGYVNIETISSPSGTTNSFKECIDQFTTLYRLVWINLPDNTASYRVQSKKCSGDTSQNCSVSPPTCSSETIVTNQSIFGDIVIHGYDGNNSYASPTLTITPGDRQLTLSWTSSTNADIFAYYFYITKTGSIPVGDGYLPRLSNHVVLGNLINGETYTITISAVNHSNIISSSTSDTKSGTPTAPPSPVLTTITLDPQSITLNPPQTQQFTPTCIDQYGGIISPCPTLNWTSTNTGAGTVNSSGLFTAISSGTTTVKATSGSIHGDANVTVSTIAPVLTSLTITPTSAYIAPAGTKSFIATPKDQNNNVMPGVPVSWSSSDTTKATVSPTTGVTTTATGVAEGVADITATATAGGVTKNAIAHVIITTTPPVAGGVGSLAIIGVAAIAIGYFLLRPKSPK